jgi:hypothetical protein
MVISTALEATAGGRPVLVLRPHPSPGRGSVEILSTLARARARAASACVLPPAGDAGELVALAASREVPLVARRGWRRSWLQTRWSLASAVRRGGVRWRQAVVAGQQEIFRELRRQAGNERLPAELRRRLRESAHRAYERARLAEGSVEGYPRRLLREPSPLTLPPAALEAGRAEAEALGFVAGPPTVTLEAGLRPDLSAALRSALAARGYRVLHLTSPSLRLTLFALCASRFVICVSHDWQQLAYLTNTPSLRVHAVDVFEAYPVRRDGLFALQPAVDLESGKVLPVGDRLSEGYFKNLRNIGFREHTVAEITAAAEEMMAGVERGWQESESQARFRDRAAAAGAALAPVVSTVAAWAPDDGFLGDGRLARVQADTA